MVVEMFFYEGEDRMENIIAKGVLVLAASVITMTCECYSNPKYVQIMSIDTQIRLTINRSLEKIQSKELSDYNVKQFKLEIGEVMASIVRHKDKVGSDSVVDAYISLCYGATELVDCLAEYMRNPTESLAEKLRDWAYIEEYGWFIESIMDRQTEQRFKFNPEE